MFGAMFRNIPNVVKNLLIINVLFFLATVVMTRQGIDLHQLLGLFYFDSDNFQPYQIMTHFFMHGDLGHLFFNMLALVVFGSHLERHWGSKRFLIFYFFTAFGAAILHMVVHGFELHQAVGTFTPVSDGLFEIHGTYVSATSLESLPFLKVAAACYGPSFGASGAVFGLIMAFAYLFPNTEFMLLFPPIPIKAKWLALLMGFYAMYMGSLNAEGDSVAHYAHLGGMLFGFILVKIWQRDKSTFY